MGLPRFGFVTIHDAALPDGPDAEREWAARAAVGGRAVAHLWRGTPGLVAPRNCTTLPGWPEAARRHPVRVRASGGGVVPQGPGVMNLSLAWPTAAAAPVDSEGVYRALCAEMAAALARLGVTAAPQAVDGSFCDGRFNLAVAGRKVAGTAQSWRRVGGRMVVLAHAVLIASADPSALTEAANAFERDLGSGRQYRADALTSVARAWREAHGAAAPDDLDARLASVLAEQLARAVPPHPSPS